MANGANGYTTGKRQTKADIAVVETVHNRKSQILYVEASKLMLTGMSRAAACRKFGIKESAYRAWYNKLSDEEKAEVSVKQLNWIDEMIDRLKPIATKAVAVYEEELNFRIERGASGKNLIEMTTSIATILDKIQLLSGKATSIISSLDEKTQEMVTNSYDRLTIIEREKTS